MTITYNTQPTLVGHPTGLPNEYPVLPERTVANGSGFPPFNSGRPPVNLVFLATCNGGATNDFSAYLFPWGNQYVGVYQPIPENQANCGYEGLVLASAHRSQAEVFFDALALGYTVHLARDFAMADYPVQPPDVWLNVYGDFATKLNGVYDGNGAGPASLAWFRQVGMP